MTIETITIGGKRYVVIPEDEYRRRHDELGVPVRSDEEMTEQDWGDVAEAQRRMNDPSESPIPWVQVVRIAHRCDVYRGP